MEKQRLLQKKAAPMVERDKLTMDLAKFSQTFKVGCVLLLDRLRLIIRMSITQLKKPIPDDLVPVLAKDEER